MAQPEVAGDAQYDVVGALYHACWSRGLDIGDPSVVASILIETGLDGEAMVARTREPAVKQALISATQQAIDRGAFGVPTMLAGGQLFWGNDRIIYLEKLLHGVDLLDTEQVTELLRRPGRHRPR